MTRPYRRDTADIGARTGVRQILRRGRQDVAQINVSNGPERFAASPLQVVTY